MSPEEQIREDKIQKLVEGYANRILEGRDDMLLLSLLEHGFPGFRNVDDDNYHFWPAQGLDSWIEQLESLTAEDEGDSE
jgi:hypothetical protein